MSSPVEALYMYLLVYIPSTTCEVDTVHNFVLQISNPKLREFKELQVTQLVNVRVGVQSQVSVAPIHESQLGYPLCLAMLYCRESVYRQSS